VIGPQIMSLNLTIPIFSKPRFLVIEIPTIFGTTNPATSWDNAHSLYAHDAWEAAKFACRFFDSQCEQMTSLPRIVEVKEDGTGLRHRLCVSPEHITIYVLEHDKANWPQLAEGVPEFEPDPPPPRQWSPDELRAQEEKTRALHENFAAHLAGCAPEGWILRPVWNEWQSSDGLYHADLLHYEIRTPEGVTAFCKGDYTGAITKGWTVEQANLAFYSDITITAPDGRRLSFSDIMLA
jgi:hypothetical protein